MLARTGCPYGLFSYERVQSQFCKALVFGLTAWVLSEDWCAEDSYSLCFVVVPHAVALSVLLAACAVLCCAVASQSSLPISLHYPSAFLLRFSG